MGLFSFLGSGKKKKAIDEAIAAGALIVDVRSPGEFQSGHVAGAENIPLQAIDKHLSRWQSTGRMIIFCCASGMRSGSAAQKASKAGIAAINGGGWKGLERMLND